MLHSTAPEHAHARTGTTTSADGTTIAFTMWGTGDPIIIVDGATGHRATIPQNREAAEMLADSFRVVNYDRRGRGSSGNRLPYSVEREYEDLAAVIADTSEGRPVTVFGWSSGAHLILHAAQAGVRIDRIAVFEPPVVVDDSRPPLAPDYVERLEEAIAAGDRESAVKQFLGEAAGVPPEMLVGLRDSEEWPTLDAVAHTLPYDGRLVGDTMSGRPLRPDLWNQITVPVLVLHGMQTWPHLIAGAQAVAKAIPTARLQSVPGEAHSISAEVLADTLRAFAGGV